MKKVAVVFGTRPEAIKLCPLVTAFREYAGFNVHVCVTAQHRQMLDQVLDLFGVRPDVDLDLMTPNQSLAALTARALTGLHAYLQQERPDLVVIQGDTTTTLSAALAAYYSHIPVGHVEAGLRTGNRFSPFPEEVNRVLTSQLSTYHFAPTKASRAALLREGISPESIFLTGNTIVDALQTAIVRIRTQPPVIPGLPPELQNGSRRPLVLITGHRRESFGRGIQSICAAIGELASRFPETAFVYPVHLNPNVQEPVFAALADRPNVHLIRPLEYLPFVALMDRSSLIITDSGGIQEEAPTLGKPVLVTRDTTERPEAVDAGVAVLVGTDQKRIVDTASSVLLGNSRELMHRANPYGDGNACKRIVEICAKELGL